MSWFRSSATRQKDADELLPQSGTGGNHMEGHANDDLTSNRHDDYVLVLSPDRPPPVTNVFTNSPIHNLRRGGMGQAPSVPPLPPPTQSPLPPTHHPLPNKQSIHELAKRRPLDPVFRAERDYPPRNTPKLFVANATPTTIHVFDPSSSTIHHQERTNFSSNDDDQENNEDEIDMPFEEQDIMENSEKEEDSDEHFSQLNSDKDTTEIVIENISGEMPSVIDSNHTGDNNSVDDPYHREPPLTLVSVEEDNEEIAPKAKLVIVEASTEQDTSEDGDIHLHDPVNHEQPSSTELPTQWETPVNSLTKHTRFVFLSDQKSVPTDMKKLKERTIKRRRDVVARLHSADCQLASILSKFAEEKMDRQLAIHDMFERTIANPLASTVDRVALLKDSSNSRMIGITNLERWLNHLDASMVHHLNVTLHDVKRDNLDSFQDEVQRDLRSEIRVETFKYDKVEGGIVRRFEQVVGMIAKNFHAEAATRRATMELLRRKVEQTIPTQQTERLEHTLSQIEQMRAQLRQERADRQVADQVIMERIVTTMGAMKRAMISLVSDAGE